MFLKLNPSKFDLIYVSKSSRLIEHLPLIDISSNLSLTPSSTIHNFGFIFDSSLSLILQVKSVAESCFFHFRRIKQLKLLLDSLIFKLLVSSLILSRFNYCNCLYYELPETILHPLTKAFNNAARLFSGTHKFSRLTPTLIATLGALKKRSVFKICVLMFKIKK